MNDFISVFDNFMSTDECEEYITLIEHYISNGIILKENESLPS